MMIKVERETLLRLVAAQPLTPQLDSTARCQNEYEFVSIRKPAFDEDFPAEKLRYHDDDSVYTVSTASLSCDADDGDFDKRVSFADSLVTEEWTRDFTLKDDIPRLFYSSEEMQRFRQEYRLERKLISDLSINPDDLSADAEVFSRLFDSKRQAHGRHYISQVVVLHQNKLETFSEEAISSDDVQFDLDSFWSGKICFL